MSWGGAPFVLPLNKGVNRNKSREGGEAKFAGNEKYSPPQELLGGGGNILTVNFKIWLLGYQA